MGLALAKIIYIEKKEEADMQRYLEKGQTIAVDIIQYCDEVITKMCAIKLYESLLGLFDDYYNVYYGRHRKAWEKDLKAHIIAIRKTCKLMLSYGLISKNQIANFVFEDDPLKDDSVTFPMVASVVFGLLITIGEI